MSTHVIYSYFMPVCSIVKTITRGAVDGLMHYCTRQDAKCNSASGRPRHLGVKFDYTTNRHEITVLLPNLFDEILSSVSCMELL